MERSIELGHRVIKLGSMTLQVTFTGDGVEILDGAIAAFDG